MNFQIGEKRTFGCAYCEENFESKSQRGSHEHQNHVDSEGNLLEATCDQCEYTFATSIKLRCHKIEEHIEEILPNNKSSKKLWNKYTCQTCDKIFRENEDLLHHQNTVHLFSDSLNNTSPRKNLKRKCET